MKFEAQIKEVKVKESVSNDREVRIVLITNDMVAKELMDFVAENTVIVEVNGD